MRTAETVVRNPSGIHARPAAMFVRTAAGFKSSVTLENLDNPGLSGNAKSMIDLMKVKAARDSRIRISAEGIDEDAAVEALVAFVDGGCGEKLEG
jgi:phosphotransferase system HPr (HPr) family protein